MVVDHINSDIISLSLESEVLLVIFFLSRKPISSGLLLKAIQETQLLQFYITHLLLREYSCHYITQNTNLCFTGEHRIPTADNIVYYRILPTLPTLSDIAKISQRAVISIILLILEFEYIIFKENHLI